MIHIVLTIDGSGGGVDLLPHWIKHYAELMANQEVVWHFWFNGNIEEFRYTIEDCEHKRDWRIKERDWLPADYLRGSRAQAHDTHRYLRHREDMTDADWYGIIDLDEFWTLPMSLGELIAASETHGIPAITGHFVDQHTSDGTLAAVQPYPSLWDQFPVESHLSRDMLHAGDTKVFLAKGDLIIGEGHHFVLDIPTFTANGVWGGTCDCHHFKWKAGLLDRVRTNLKSPAICESWRAEATELLRIADECGGKIPPHYGAR